MARYLLTLLLLAPLPGLAQPANCSGPPGAPGVGGLATVGINLAGRAAAATGTRPTAPPPGAQPAPPGTPPPPPQSALGLIAGGASTFLTLPLELPGNACHDHPRPPEDVLHGEPGDVLHGPHAADLLRGPGEPHVRMGAPQPVRATQ